MKKLILFSMFMGFYGFLNASASNNKSTKPPLAPVSNIQTGRPSTTPHVLTNKTQQNLVTQDVRGSISTGNNQLGSLQVNRSQAQHPLTIRQAFYITEVGLVPVQQTNHQGPMSQDEKNYRCLCLLENFNAKIADKNVTVQDVQQFITTGLAILKK